MVTVVLLVRVLVLSPEAEPAPPRFVEQLGIHLAESAVVERGPAVLGKTLPEKIESAVGAVDASDAALAVWVERASDDGGEELEFILHIVGRRDGRLLVEVLRVPAREGPDLDRTLALKVGEVLDRALRDEDAGAAVAMWIGSDAAVDTEGAEGAAAVVVQSPPPSPARRQWLLGLDARVAGGLDAPSTQYGGAFAGGLRWRGRGLAAEAFAAAGVDSGLAATGALGEAVTTDEITTAVGGRLLARVDRLWVGAALAAGLRLVDAEGTTPRNNTGTEWVVVPTVTAAVDGRWPLAASLELRLAAGLEWSPNRVTLTVNDQAVVNLGRVRPVAELSLVFLIP